MKLTLSEIWNCQEHKLWIEAEQNLVELFVMFDRGAIKALTSMVD